MNIRPITEARPCCFGLNCPPHAGCQRYHAVDGSDPSEPRIDTCKAADGTYPMFVPLTTAPAKQVSA